MKQKLLTTLFAIVLISIAATAFTFRRKPSLVGAWKVVEVRVVKADNTYTSVFPAESQVLFTKNYYSICWTSHSSKIRNWQVPDTTKLSRFNQSIVNTGSYELNDSILITKAAFAMNPMFVNGVAAFRYAFAGDTLILTGTGVFSSDNIPHPVYAGGSHIVNKLVRIKEN